MEITGKTMQELRRLPLSFEYQECIDLGRYIYQEKKDQAGIKEILHKILKNSELYEKERVLALIQDKSNSIVGVNRIRQIMTKYRVPHDESWSSIDVNKINGKTGVDKPVHNEKLSITDAPTTSELLQHYKDYEAQFICYPLIFQRGNNIIAAERGTGKTRFCLSLAYAIIYNATSFLGYKLNCTGNVLYLNFEIHAPEFSLFLSPIDKYARTAYKTQNLSGQIRVINFLSDPKLSINMVDTVIEKLSPILVIVDSFKAFAARLLLEHQETNLTNLNINLIYDTLNRWRQKFNVTVLLTNHTNKGTKDKRSHSDLMFGPSSLMDYADHTCLLRKTNEPNQRLIIPDKMRFAQEGAVGNNLIELCSNDENQQLWFELLKTDVNENDYRYRNEKSGYDEGAKEIVLQHHNEGLSIRQIEEKTGVAKSTVQRWIKADDGKSVKKEMSQVSHY